MKIRILALLLIIVGLGTIAYPWFKSFYFEQQKKELIEQWIMNVPVIEAESKPDFDYIFFRETPDVYETVNEVVYTAITADIPENMEGIIYIDAIGLQSPILYGETESNLNLAICRLYDSAVAGGDGNYCLSGHKSRIYGRQFNRLHEVSVGDTVKIQTRDEVFLYSLTGKFTITEYDVWVLESDMTKKEITLITCDYNQQPTGRLIIKGELMTD